nr:hypothetical protein [uncultured Chryseobacterium sp.]
MILRILKFIGIISFFFTEGFGEHATLNIGLILISIYQFIFDLFSSEYGILWEGLAALPVVGVVFIFLSIEEYKYRYLMVFCFIVLIIASSLLTGLLNFSSYDHNRVPVGFIIPSLIFIISSLLSITLMFRNKNN